MCFDFLCLILEPKTRKQVWDAGINNELVGHFKIKSTAF